MVVAVALAGCVEPLPDTADDTVIADTVVEDEGLTIGHGAPGDEVVAGDGNPGSYELAAWFAVVAAWMDAHLVHFPATDLPSMPWYQDHLEGQDASR